jgi:transglutaminase-like putative cysteine protease
MIGYRLAMARWMGAAGIVLAGGCTSFRQSDASLGEFVPHVVTADIQQGIERYIDEQTRAGGGYFALMHEDKPLRLKLVRVHTEYLANLGPGRHFACVDLASTEGDVFDVDFFMAGEPGDMTVTETTIHKINGQPFYLWKQNDAGLWDRVPVEDGSPYLMGIVEDRDHFEFLYQVRLPELIDAARMWIPLPQTDQFQEVKIKEICAPGEQKVLIDQRYGNEVLFLSLTPRDSHQTVVLRFEVQRREKGVYRENDSAPQQYLEPEQRIPASDQFKTIAADILADKRGAGDLVRARALYDHTMDRLKYMRFGEGYGEGDAVRACDVASGNCTDFHSYFIALARSTGIPARFAIGAAIPSERNDGGVDGYHCWAEFYAEDQWWPVDISEADKYSSLATYYFGHHPANRIELSRGRDLIVDPGPVSGPINFLAFPVLEVGNQPVSLRPTFSFRRLTR